MSARESPSVARARQRNLSVRPSVGRARSELKVRAVRASTDDMRSLSLNECFLGGGLDGLLCFVLVLGVGALLDRGLGPPGANVPRRLFCMCFASVFR